MNIIDAEQHVMDVILRIRAEIKTATARIAAMKIEQKRLERQLYEEWFAPCGRDERVITYRGMLWRSSAYMRNDGGGSGMLIDYVWVKP